jgi:hypothetical protein
MCFVIKKDIKIGVLLIAVIMYSCTQNKPNLNDNSVENDNYFYYGSTDSVAYIGEVVRFYVTYKNPVLPNWMLILGDFDESFTLVDSVNVDLIAPTNDTVWFELVWKKPGLKQYRTKMMSYELSGEDSTIFDGYENNIEWEILVLDTIDRV